MNNLLEVKRLSVCYKNEDNYIKAVRDVNFVLDAETALGIIGESGSGKTTIGMSIMGLLDQTTEIEGEINYRNTSLLEMSEKQCNQYRWKSIAMVFQNNLNVLNPVLTIYEQIAETIIEHMELTTNEVEERVNELLKKVELDVECKSIYPHQLSGGMRQKVLIAMGIACDPEILIVDEPTTALDAMARNEIINLLSKLHKENRFAMIVISHDLQVITKLTAKLLVIYSGHVMEEGMTKKIIQDPMHTYTRGLINASHIKNPYLDLWGIPEADDEREEGACPFYPRCNQRSTLCRTQKPELKYHSIERKVACNQGGILTVMEGKNISKAYKRNGLKLDVCKNCDIEIKAGEVVALIGESGAGKSSLASVLAGHLTPDNGSVAFFGKIIRGNEATRKKSGMQMVFQDPFSSINDNFTVEQAVKEPLDIIRSGLKEERIIIVKSALKDVQLPDSDAFLKKRCYALSGGQRQRVALARSLVMEPKLLIADEISSMLDPSIQANVLRLLKGLQNTKGFAMLYITHDLNIARKIADKVLVMYRGEIIENGMTDAIFSNPRNEYTQRLIMSGTE